MPSNLSIQDLLFNHSAHEKSDSSRHKQTLALTLAALITGVVVGVVVGAHVSIGAGVGAGIASAYGAVTLGALVLGVRSWVNEKKQQKPDNDDL